MRLEGAGQGGRCWRANEKPHRGVPSCFKGAQFVVLTPLPEDRRWFRSDTPGGLSGDRGPVCSQLPPSPPGYRRRAIPQASALITCVDMVTPSHRSPPRHGRAGRSPSAPEGRHRFSTHLSAAAFPSPNDRRPHRRAPSVCGSFKGAP